MGSSFISINNVASAQFDFGVEDWVERSRRAQELPLSINGYEVSPRPPGHACHRPGWVWVEADAAARKVPWSEFPGWWHEFAGSSRRGCSAAEARRLFVGEFICSPGIGRV